jgi:hypothetical protein
MVAKFLATAATTSGALPTQIPQVPQSNQGALQQPIGLGMQQSLGMSQSIGMPQGLQEAGPMSAPMAPSSGQGMTVSAPHSSSGDARSEIEVHATARCTFLLNIPCRTCWYNTRPPEHSRAPPTRCLLAAHLQCSKLLKIITLAP